MSELLTLALRARIPLVRVTSNDPHHLGDVLTELAQGRTVRAWDSMLAGGYTRLKQGVVYFGYADAVNLDKISYTQLLEREVSIVIVNDADDLFLHARDCGAITPPIDYLQTELSALLPEGQAEQFGRYFAGMSLKDTIETIMMTQARDGGLSCIGINETKSYLGAGLAGLEALDTKQVDYVAPSWAADWLETETKLLGQTKYRELWPKGFMLVGPSGTGKTEFSRYLAGRLQWPLYRLDLGGIYSRWQGQSESNLRQALNFISSQGESVLLLDEAEKLFSDSASGQASQSTMLSMLLWWLQGESNRTVTIMTANNLDVIPPELYRPGRLDAVHLMAGLLTADELFNFADAISTRLADKFKLSKYIITERTREGLTTPVPQATVVAKARSVVKSLLAKGKGL